jgi:nitric oxide dioxygenase
VFKGDRRARFQKYISIVSATVRGLGNEETLLSAVRALGVRHARFAASDFHLASVGQALIWSLEKSLRNDFTPEVRSAWIAACEELSQTMRGSGAPAPERRIA